MRRLLLSLLILTVVATSAIGVNASTDCERWIASYKQSMAQQSAAKRLKAAKQRLRRFAKRKIAAYAKPKATSRPKLVRASSKRPRLTPRQMLDRFNVLCGDLPETVIPGVLDARALPEFKFETASFEPIDTDSPPAPSFLAQAVLPAFSGSTTSGLPSGGAQGSFQPSFGPIFGGGSFPTSSSIVSGGGGAGDIVPSGATPVGITPGITSQGTTPSGTTPGSTTSGGTIPSGGTTSPDLPIVLPVQSPDLPADVPPTQTPVPEPGSILLLLTGAAGGGRLIRRRIIG